MDSQSQIKCRERISWQNARRHTARMRRRTNRADSRNKRRQGRGDVADHVSLQNAMKLQTTSNQCCTFVTVSLVTSEPMSTTAPNWPKLDLQATAQRQAKRGRIRPGSQGSEPEPVNQWSGICVSHVQHRSDAVPKSPAANIQQHATKTRASQRASKGEETEEARGTHPSMVSRLPPSRAQSTVLTSAYGPGGA